MKTEKYAIFDLEIVRAIPPKDEADSIPGIEYCSGWKDFGNMGISCISFCVMGLQGDRVLETENFCYEWDTEIALNHITFMREDDFLIGGFNSRKFDDQLLTANGIDFKSDFDILELVIKAANLEGVKYWEMDPKRSYSLDAITKANGAVKTGKGDLAPIWWQQGEKQRVIDYCRNDSQIEADMLRLLMAGNLVDPNTGEMLRSVGAGVARSDGNGVGSNRTGRICDRNSISPK